MHSYTVFRLSIRKYGRAGEERLMLQFSLVEVLFLRFYVIVSYFLFCCGAKKSLFFDIFSSNCAPIYYLVVLAPILIRIDGERLQVTSLVDNRVSFSVHFLK
jgi:hypothetical protein